MPNYARMTKAELTAALKKSEARRNKTPVTTERDRLLARVKSLQVELKDRNEQLQQTRELVEESHRRYAELYDQAPVAFCTLDARGLIRDINATGAALLGVERTRLLRRAFGRLVRRTQRGRFEDYLRRCGSTPGAEVLEIELEPVPDRRIVVQLSTVVVNGTVGRTDRYRMVMVDVGAWAQAREELYESKERFRVALSHSPIVVFNQDRDLRYTWVHHPHSPALASTILGKTDADLYSPKEAARLNQVKRRVLSTGAGARQEIALESGGTLRTFDWMVEPLRDARGQIVGLTSAAMDITAARQAEAARRQAESDLGQVLASIPDYVWSGEIDAHGKMLRRYDSPVMKQVTGLSPEALRSHPQSWLDTIHPDDRIATVSAFVRMASGQSEREELEYRILLPEGKLRWVRDCVQTRRMENGRLRVDGVVADITERKRAEEEIRTSERKYRQLFEGMSNGCALHEIVCDPEGRPVDYVTLEVNAAYERLLQVSREAVVGRRAYESFPDLDREWLDLFGRVALTGEPHHYVQYASNVDKWFEGSAFRPREGQFCVTFSDVTERVRADQRLRASEERFRKVWQVAVDGLVLSDPDGVLLEVNPAFCRMVERTHDELVGMNFLDLFAESRRDPAMLRGYRSVFVQPSAHATYRIALPRRDGAERLVQTCFDFLEVGERRTAMLSLLHDITEQVRTEEGLRLSEARLKQAQEIGNMGSYHHDLSTGAVWWSDQIYRLLDWDASAEKAGFDRLRRIIHPDDAKRWQEFFDESRRLGGTHENEYRVLRSDGSIRYLHELVSVTLPPEGRLREARGTLQDITERRHIEESLRQSRYRLAAAEEMAGLGSFEVDLVTHRLIWSDEMFRIADRDPRAGEPTIDEYLQKVHPDDRAAVVQVIHRALTENFKFDYEYRLVCPNGAVKTLHSMGRTVTNDQGAVVRLMGAVLDVTERKRNEEGVRTLSRAVAQSPVSVVITDAFGRIEYVNPRFTQITGYMPSDVVGQNPRLLQSGKTPPQVYRHLWDTVTAGVTWQGDLYNRRKNGECYWESIAISPILDPEGTITHYLAVGEDTTERKQAEERLRESEERFRLLTEVSPAGIFVTDAQGLCTYVNERWCEIAGMTPGEAQGEGWVRALHDRDRESVVAGWRQAVATRDRWQQEYRFHNAARGSVWVVTQAAEFRMPQGETIGFIGTVTDITERKKAEEELRRRNQDLVTLNAIITRISHAHTLQSILRAMLDVVLEVTRKETSLVLLRDEQTELYEPSLYRGFASEALVSIAEACRNSSLVRQVIQTGRAAASGEAAEGTGSAQDPHGPTAAVPIRSRERVLGVMVLFGPGGRELDAQNEQLLTMIGDQVGVAIENTRLAEKAAVIEVWREIDRLRSELIANVSHELRTPLGLIKLFSSALVGHDLPLDSVTREQFLTDIVEETDKLAQIVDNLLDISRQQNDRLRLNKLPVDLVLVVQDVIKTASVQLDRHRLEYEGPGGPVMVIVDRLAIEQVLRNLLSNAVKYSPQGGTVTVTVLQGPRHVVVQVSDPGIGIPVPDLERIFDRFYRVPNQETQSIPGMGLGLAVSRGIVEAHGGRIWAESQLGSGSSLFVSLPHSLMADAE